MAEYWRFAYPLARAAVETCPDRAGARTAGTQISNVFIVSCTGYRIPSSVLSQPPFSGCRTEGL